jgi:hypothetical protein
LVSLMHTLVIMPSGPHRIEGGSCVPGGGSGIFDPTVQNSHLPGLIASSAPAAHAHTSVTRMRMAVAPTAVAARIFASAPSGCCRSAHHGRSQASRAHERPLWVCAVTRRRFPVGASPTRQPLQPEATGAGMEATKCLKPSGSGSRIGDRASVQAATRVNAEQASKRTMCRPTRQPFRGRLIRPGEMSEEYAQLLHRGSGGSMYTRKAHATRETPTRDQG